MSKVWIAIFPSDWFRRERWKYSNLARVWRGSRQVSHTVTSQSASAYFGQISDYPALLTSLWGWRAQRGADLNKSITTNLWWYNCFSCNQLGASSFLLYRGFLREKSIDLLTIKFLFEVYKKRVDVLLLSLTNSYNTIILSEWSGGGGAADLIVRLPHYPLLPKYIYRMALLWK